LTVPATETLQGMRNGTMETFSTGDPWPSRIGKDGIGYLAALTAQIWPVSRLAKIFRGWAVDNFDVS
jgi:bicarbonate transport system substrate-binding protein